MVHRPRHLVACCDPRSLRITDAAARLLKDQVPPYWEPPYWPRDARVRLTRWTRSMDEMIAESSACGVYIDILAKITDEDLSQRMGAWLRGEWSNEVGALEELLWRMELGRRTISAALWLHRIGVDDKQEDAWR